MDWLLELGEVLQDLAPIFLQVLNDYKEGKLEDLKNEVANAQTPEQKRQARIDFAQRFYSR